MKKIFFDVETANQFSDVGSTEATALDMSVVCIIESDGTKESGQCFAKDNLAGLWKILEKADMLIGFNSEHFDIPLLNKYYDGDLAKIRSLDLLKEIKKVLGFRVKLDSVAEATLGRKKIGHGLEAVLWWQNGEKEKVMKYCLEDVRITKEIYEYAVKNNSLKYMDKGKAVKFEIDASAWGKEPGNAITHTLPF